MLPEGISALDVAFVSAIATLVAALGAPAATWLIAKERHQHERQLALDERLFARRAEAYEEMMLDVQRTWVTTRAIHDALVEDPHVVMPAQPELEEMIRSAARHAVVGSRDLLSAHQRFLDECAGFVAQTTVYREKLRGGESLSKSDRADLLARLRIVGSARDEVAALAQKDLTELSQ